VVFRQKEKQLHKSETKHVKKKDGREPEMETTLENM
jgi:hypothetical protein